MGRHRNRRAMRAARQLGVAVIVLGLLGTGVVGYRVWSRPGCTDPVKLTVGAAPEIATAIKKATDAWVDTDAAKINNRCLSITVSAADPADVAGAVAGQRQLTLSGIGKPSGATTVPDVWVPDSSLWVQRLRALSQDVLPANSPSIARSPVVLAAPEPVATSLGWPAAKPTWSDLLTKARSDSTLHLGIVDPARDSASLASLVALTGGGTAGSATTASPEARAALVAAVRTLAAGRSLIRDDLLRRFPRASDPVSLASGLSLAPLPEHAIFAYDAERPPVRLVGLAVQPAPPALDYPYIVLPLTTDDRALAASALRTVLAGYGFRDRLSAVGLRASDGSVGAGFPSQLVSGVDNGQSSALDGALAGRALDTWSSITAPARLLAVLDVSGSMLEPVPTAGGITRMACTLEAAKRGLGLFDEGWAVGLWTFSTQLEGDRDYRELAPIGPISVQREALARALAGITPKRNGNTGLYETVLAAYKAVQSGWDPGRVNSVVLLTDGENDDPGGPTIDQTIEQLKLTADPKRPVQVILVGIGGKLGEVEMRRITEVTGGSVFITEDPAKIGEVFLQALAMRPASAAGR